MSWIKTSDRKPTGDELTSSYPFVSNDAEKSWSDPHMGNYVDSSYGWWCDSCQAWVEDSIVVAWFDLPPYEPHNTSPLNPNVAHLITCAVCQTLGDHDTSECPNRHLVGL